MSYGDKPFGLREIKVYSADGSAGVALPVSLMMHITPVIKGESYSADGFNVGESSTLVGLDWELESGGLNLEAYAKLLGLTLTAAGTAPNRTQTLAVGGQEVLPYLRIHGRAVGDTIDGMTVKLYRCKLTSLEGTFRRADYYITSCAGVAVRHSTLGLYDMIGQETKVAL